MPSVFDDADLAPTRKAPAADASEVDLNMTFDGYKRFDVGSAHTNVIR